VTGDGVCDAGWLDARREGTQHASRHHTSTAFRRVRPFRVRITTHAPEWTQARIPVRLTRNEVKRSPDIDTHTPVSRAAEAAALSYYGYPFYWSGPALWGTAVSPGPIAAMPRPVSAPIAKDERDTHLRSCREVSGYHIRARDGEIGHIDDFVIDGEIWRIDHLLVDTSNWIGGRSILLHRRQLSRSHCRNDRCTWRSRARPWPDNRIPRDNPAPLRTSRRRPRFDTRRRRTLA
jgi:hypothetical protein